MPDAANTNRQIFADLTKCWTIKDSVEIAHRHAKNGIWIIHGDIWIIYSSTKKITVCSSIRGVSEKHPTVYSISALVLFFVIRTMASFEVLRIWLNHTLPAVLPHLKGRLNTDTSPQDFWTTFLDNDLREIFKKSAVANAIAIPLPLCFSCFVENLIKPFYLYLSRTCDSTGVTPSVISLALKQSSNADFGMAFSSRVALLWIVSMSSNRFPLSAIFNFGNIQKSQEAMSRLYGSWRSFTILCFAKNCCTMFDERAGALSWWRSQSPLDQKRGRFRLTASRNLFRTST